MKTGIALRHVIHGVKRSRNLAYRRRGWYAPPAWQQPRRRKSHLMSIPGRREDGADTWWYLVYRRPDGSHRVLRNLGQGSEPPPGWFRRASRRSRARQKTVAAP